MADRVEVAIIGYGVAGVNAAIALRNAGYEGVIRAFSDTDIPPYSPILTSYYAGGQKAYEECFPWDARDLELLDVELMRGCEVLSLDTRERIIRTAEGDFPYAKCIIASGARPVTRGFPEVEGYEPFVLRTMDDASRLKEMIERSPGKSVLVSGASMIAVKCVEACLCGGVRCSLVGMGDHILDFSALPETAARFERGLSEKGVSMRFRQTISQVRVVEGRLAGSDSTVRADGSVDGIGVADRMLEVTFSSGDVECFDEIVVAHGVASNLGFVEKGSLETDRALVVDEFMRTSDPDVYAAGDVAQAFEPLSGRKCVMGVWKAAALQGACAGSAIAAELAGRVPAQEDAYRGLIAANTIAVSGTLFISGGITMLQEGCQADIVEESDMTVARIFRKEDDGRLRLVGFNVASDVDEAGGRAYDIAAMLTLRIEAACRA